MMYLETKDVGFPRLLLVELPQVKNVVEFQEAKISVTNKLMLLIQNTAKQFQCQAHLYMSKFVSLFGSSVLAMASLTPAISSVSRT